MDEKLVKELVEIGLSEKEARVYLAALGLGPATAQNIAIKALVNRPTTYIMIESLTRRGLMSQVLQGKKKLFVAKEPTALSRVIQKNLEDLSLKKKEVNSLILKVSKLYKAENVPEILMLEGEEGVKRAKEYVLNHPQEGSLLRTIVSIDRLLARDEYEGLDDFWKKMGSKKLRVRSIFRGENKHKSFGNKYLDWETRCIAGNDLFFDGELTIFDDSILVFTLQSREAGFILENKETAQMVKALFDLSWLNLEK